MTLEFILVLGISVFGILAVFISPDGPKAVFVESLPYLGARVEQHISTGNGFNFQTSTVQWIDPN